MQSLLDQFLAFSPCKLGLLQKAKGIYRTFSAACRDSLDFK